MEILCLRQNTASRRTTSARCCIYAYQCLNSSLCVCIRIRRVIIEVDSEYQKLLLLLLNNKLLSFPPHHLTIEETAMQIIHNLRHCSI